MKILFYFLITTFLLTSTKSFVSAIVNNNIYQMSTQSEETKSDFKMKAVLTKCHQENENCQQNVSFKIWLNFPQTEKDYRLVIDEIFDPVKQITHKLMNPYLIILKTHEPILMYPLIFEKTIKSTCKNSLSGNEIIRRNINSNGKHFKSINDEASDFNKLRDVFGEIKEHENEIKMDLNEYHPSNKETLHDRKSDVDGDDLLVYFDDKTEQKQKQQKQNNQYQAQQQSHNNQGFKNVLNCDCLCKQCMNFAGYEKCVCCNHCEGVNPLNPTTATAKNYKLWNENLAGNNGNQQETRVAPQSISFANSDFNKHQLQNKIYSKTAAEPFVSTSKHKQHKNQQKCNQDKFSYQQLNLLNEPNVNEFAARTNDDDSVVAMKGENGKFRGLQNNYHNEDFNYQATANNQNGFMMKNKQLQNQGDFGVENNEMGDYEQRMDTANYDYTINRDQFNGKEQLGLKIEGNRKPAVGSRKFAGVPTSDMKNWIQSQEIDYNKMLKFGGKQNLNKKNYHLQTPGLLNKNENSNMNQYENSQRPNPSSHSRKWQLHNLQRAQKTENPAIIQGNMHNNDENIDLHKNGKDIHYNDGAFDRRSHSRMGERNIEDEILYDDSHFAEYYDESEPIESEDDPNWLVQQYPRIMNKRPESSRNFANVYSSRRGRKLDSNLESIINDRNLTIDDKLYFMNSLTTNKKLDEKFNQVEHELDPTVILNSRHKRSVAFNEMTNSDTEDVAEENEENANRMSQVGNSQKHKNEHSNNQVGSRDENNFSNEENSVWYSIFNINQPTHYISTTIQLYRKQSSSWQQIIPATLISNLSGDFVNKSIVISISSRSNVLDNTEGLEKMKLLVPKNSPHNDILMSLSTDNQDVSQAMCYENSNDKRSVEKLKNIGTYPKKENVLGQCKGDANEICLNLVDEHVNPYRVSIQVPFEHNVVVDEHNSSVKISNVVTDASVSSNLHAQFTIMSLSQFTKHYSLTLSRCPLLMHLNVSHEVELMPNKPVTVDMNITVPLYLETKEEICEAEIRDSNHHLVAKREFPVKLDFRCICMWFCSCFCFDMFLTAEAHDLCHAMSPKNEYFAGFGSKKKDDVWDLEPEQFEPDLTFWILVAVAGSLLLMILMGCVKALLGCCVPSVGRWKYSYMQPNLSYREAGRCRRFFINLIFFLMFPCVCCCYCFTRKKDSEEEHMHGYDGSRWGRSIKQEEYYSESETDDENSQLLNSSSSSKNYSYKNDTSETLFDIHSQKSKEDQQVISDTEYVIGAINKSHESLRTLESHYSEESLPNNPKYQKAKEKVQRLLAASIVYRKFNKPLGNVSLQENQSYSIRGYFLPSHSTGYQFITYSPVTQFWEVSNGSLMLIHPNINLDFKPFRRIYANKLEVLEANDLLVFPTPSFPCINVKEQNEDMYKLSSSSINMGSS